MNEYIPQLGQSVCFDVQNGPCKGWYESTVVSRYAVSEKVVLILSAHLLSGKDIVSSALVYNRSGGFWLLETYGATTHLASGRYKARVQEYSVDPIVDIVPPINAHITMQGPNGDRLESFILMRGEIHSLGLPVFFVPGMSMFGAGDQSYAFTSCNQGVTWSLLSKIMQAEGPVEGIEYQLSTV